MLDQGFTADTNCASRGIGYRQALLALQHWREQPTDATPQQLVSCAMVQAYVCGTNNDIESLQPLLLQVPVLVWAGLTSKLNTNQLSPCLCSCIKVCLSCGVPRSFKLKFSWRKCSNL